MKTKDLVELKKKKGLNLQKLLAPLALVIIYAFFALFGRNFFSYTTLVNILDSSYYIGFLAIGVTFVIITGGIDLSCGTVMMAATIIGGTAYKTWGWPMWISLILIIVVATSFGLFNGIMVSRLKLPPFIATLGTMMISLGTGSIVSNVRSATFPARGAEDSWFKGIFKFIAEDNTSYPTGAIVLFGTAFIAYIILTRTKMGRYIFAVGSNKEAARLSGINVAKWEMMAYVISGFLAGIGGIAFAAVYTTVMPAQGQGFELYAIAGTVIGGTSLSGGAGSVFGTMIGVYIMSVLRAGLPSMDLQSQYQTFFTGVVVLGAVMLDIYRTKKSSEVRILSESDRYKEEMLLKISQLKAELSSADPAAKTEIEKKLAELRLEMRAQYRALRREEKTHRAELRKKEKAFVKR
ncbi:MAG: ABC transporter permease [Sphaerochaeta sp.]|uniref:ABC transporter permease subunit n=1 Tax=Sphaerochaeta sp. S2 TaxID=2798868 RepID=UPI0018E943E8|nr:ABC transporter permease [Sphaerochaeta sp. S2]MBJ2355991.1 ABC transporter permease [Sphaerochaeta sp. S2]MCK9349035.1 ABC transporter permease [Sphaerochaeta sp.]MDD4302539.1 ABC transporter permease [Sphaerochaeta sp.]MDD4647990.1 ABC transporter permease [Sphaerochaeta sp.]